MSAPAAQAHLVQISVSNGGVPKLAVPKARVTTEGVEGDAHRSPGIHGGPDRAVCLFSLERIDAMREEGHSIYPGASGENFTISGLNWDEVAPGRRMRVGSVRLEIMSYTAPCLHNVGWFEHGDISRISQKKHPGWSRVYAKVLTEGTVEVGDAVELEGN
jgi:MOSC domain-containing protein YiiM